jgi:hypothetical protein
VPNLFLGGGFDNGFGSSVDMDEYVNMFEMTDAVELDWDATLPRDDE